MTPDPKWLGLFKALDLEHMFAVALGAALLLGVAHWGWIPPLVPWMTQLAWAVFLLFGCLWFVGLLVTILMEFLEIHR
jgi:hypothetical protein